MPASVTPMASTTAMQPSGIASMAARVDIGEDQDSGVARSSRAGTKRSVNARPDEPRLARAAAVACRASRRCAHPARPAPAGGVRSRPAALVELEVLDASRARAEGHLELQDGRGWVAR